MELILDTQDINVFSNNNDIFYQSGTRLFGQQSLLMGMSPGNGYFTEESMIRIISGLCQCVPTVYILIPDKPHIYNFLGMGYSLEQAQRKSKKDINQTKNRLNRAIDRIKDEYDFTNFSVVDWDEKIANHRSYRLAIDKIMAEYDNNSDFRHTTNSVTYEYLSGRAKDRTAHNIDVTHGVIYYLEELALFASQSQIFGEDLSIAYYRKWGEGLSYISQIFPDFIKNFSIIQYELKEKVANVEQVPAMA